MNNSLLDEIKDYSADDLRLILSTQQELYNENELELIKAQLIKREELDKKAEQEFINQHLPDEITCPKCEGINSFKNEVCCYCGHRFDKRKYYKIDYYTREEYEKESDSEDEGKSYVFQYVISFLIPLAGFILGAILLSKDDEEEKSVGKSLIRLC